MEEHVPDVTVVVAVYNTMPYLTECLESLFAQSIGTDRLQVVAVDDGSTDGGGAELDRWAARFPDSMVVLHQPNSGGPAGPSNLALEHATGRYVFFVGSDDRLGAEALERLVRAADELDADVLLGRLVGAGGRYVNQAVFRPGDQDDISLADAQLSWALSNTKLFRRSLIEEHGIRYPEDMASCSDQPFTIRALLAARRIAVRTGYEFYYAVRRTDSSNITFRTSVTRFLHDTETLMAFADTLITEPRARFNVLRRHFSWEVSKLVGARFLAAGPEDREAVRQGVAKLVESYLTDEVRRSLDVRHRVAISVAQHGTADDVAAVAEHYAEHGAGPLVHDGGRFYAAFPGFRAGGFPDEWFDATAEAYKGEHQLGPARLAWGRTADGRPALTASWPTWLPAQPDEAEPVLRISGGLDVPVAVRGEFGQVTATAAIPLDALAGGRPRLGPRAVSFVRTAEGQKARYPLSIKDVSAVRGRLHRVGARMFLIGVAPDKDGALRLVVLPLAVGQLARGLRRKLGR
ncbi:glycosyltransferase family A protein [Actinoplanes sp. L3-i22]|uniref:glycosyltransferase family 2 protein n=1 Tax=Actinoplanes sp. L3-i22 TaxID=2836373 RepID=UPI001C7983CD|nr:glycosyltransferase family A protein [Actinoplanes sp. L3-i22]BCY14994.1 hypothetical protein L3i22_100820 [Actinoplanes sp. L3-i22]